MPSAPSIYGDACPICRNVTEPRALTRADLGRRLARYTHCRSDWTRGFTVGEGANA